MSFMILAKVEQAGDRPAFRNWMREGFAARFKDRIAHCTVTLAFEDNAHPAYDALVEGDGGSRPLFEALRDAFGDQGAAVTVYSVTRMVEKAPPAPRLDAVKMVACIRQRPDLSKAETRRHWDEHVPLALRIHVGASRYVRNWVEEVVLSSGFSPAGYPGIATMAFHTEADFRERLYDTPENAKVIAEDVAEFMTGTDSFLGQETLIGWGQPT